jgi:hypothetical protein
MLNPIRKRFTYTNVAVTLALVLAMSGGAYAAGKYVITSTKQIKPSVLKQLTGKAGPAGPAGPAGTPGAGTAGPPGPAGANGTNGTNGGNGESVTVAAASPAECKEGGAKFSNGTGSGKACNGKEGKEGPTGPQGPLQAGKSEGGEWSITSFAKAGELRIATLSFNIPVATPLAPAKVHFIEPGGVVPPGCAGSVEKPEAASGNLCVFTQLMLNLNTMGTVQPPVEGIVAGKGADVSGTRVLLEATGEGQVLADGAWVVTG